jgi:hypothetical protein
MASNIQGSHAELGPLKLVGLLGDAEALTSRPKRFNSMSMVLHTKEVLSEVFEKYIQIILLQMASGSGRIGMGNSIELATRSRLPRPPQFS